MPKEFDACVTDLTQKHGKNGAYAMCTSSFMHAYGMTPAYASAHMKEFNAKKKEKSQAKNKVDSEVDLMKNAEQNDLWLFGEISKVDHENHMIYGYATTSALDSQGEIITKEATTDALQDYSKWRNIREMHQAKAVGTAPVLQMLEKGLYVGAKIVDDQAWKKVEAGVYKGFSIGGKRGEEVREFDAKLNRTVNKITKYKLNEISLVDRPANPEAIFNVAKRDDAEDVREQEVTTLPEEIQKAEPPVEVKPPEPAKEIQKVEEIKVEPAPPKVDDEVPPLFKAFEKPEEPAKVEKTEDSVTLTKAEYESLLKAKETAETLAKKGSIDDELLKRIEALVPEKKYKVEKTDRDEEAEIKKMGIGELAVKSGFWSTKDD